MPTKLIIKYKKSLSYPITNKKTAKFYIESIDYEIDNNVDKVRSNGRLEFIPTMQDTKVTLELLSNNKEDTNNLLNTIHCNGGILEVEFVSNND